MDNPEQCIIYEYADTTTDQGEGVSILPLLVSHPSVIVFSHPLCILDISTNSSSGQVGQRIGHGRDREGGGRRERGEGGARGAVCE